MISGLGSLLAVGALAIAAIAWFRRHQGVWNQRARLLLAAIVAGYCGGVALILVIGSLEGGDSLRLGGVLSVVAFALIACGAVMSAKRRPAKT